MEILGHKWAEFHLKTEHLSNSYYKGQCNKTEKDSDTEERLVVPMGEELGWVVK